MGAEDPSQQRRSSRSGDRAGQSPEAGTPDLYIFYYFSYKAVDQPEDPAPTTQQRTADQPDATTNTQRGEIQRRQEVHTITTLTQPRDYAILNATKYLV